MQAFYLNFKKEQKFTKKELKSLEDEFNLYTECNTIDINNKGLSALTNERHDEDRIKDAVSCFFNKKDVEISEISFYEE